MIPEATSYRSFGRRARRFVDGAALAVIVVLCRAVAAEDAVEVERARQAAQAEQLVGVAVDLGLDLRLMRGGPLAGKSIRFGASIGDHDALAVGIVF